MSDLTISTGVAVGTALPEGIHPQDQRGPTYSPVQPEPSRAWHPGRKPFSTANGEALPVCERAAEEWSARTVNLAAGNNPLRCAQRAPGRKEVIVWIAADAAAGCILAPTRDMVDDSYGVRLEPGGSISLRTEASVWAAMDATQTATTLYVVELINPAAPVPGN